MSRLRTLEVRLTAVVALCAALLAPPAMAEEASSATVLDVVFLDTSTEGDYFGAREDEAKRIELLRARLNEAFAELGLEMLDPAPVQKRIDTVANVSRANGLDATLAEELGADLAITAEVQKVSNLILTINIVVRRAGSGEVLRAGNADIRSNTDKAWLRGLNYILKNRIFVHGPIEIG